VKGVFKTDDGRAAGIRTRDFHRVLDSLGSAIQQERLLRKSPGAAAFSFSASFT
jgi:hypothetical protein